MGDIEINEKIKKNNYFFNSIFSSHYINCRWTLCNGTIFQQKIWAPHDSRSDKRLIRCPAGKYELPSDHSAGAAESAYNQSNVLRHLTELKHKRVENILKIDT